jgi:hypothetical protein
MSGRLNNFGRDTIWTALDGRKIPIHALTDVHLANVIHNLKRTMSVVLHTRPKLKPEYEQLLEALYEETRIRNLSQSFLDAAPHPWQDDDGKWKIDIEYDDENGYGYKTVGQG